MELKKFARLLFYASVVLFFASSCVKEGPMGPAGKDGTNGTNGTDGADGTVSCLACHSGTAMDQKKAEFAMSEHSLGAVAVAYAGGQQGCARCHSSQGFIEYATLGAVAGNISNPSAWECNTCHGLHKTFQATDYALRLDGAVASNINSTYKFDFGNNSNLCVNCHQARTAEPATASAAGATTFRITSVHYGPHHGPQGNVVAGVGFAELAGPVSYPAPGSFPHFKGKDNFKGGCTGCHMGDFKNKQGGHSLIPSLDACNKCHGATETSYNHSGFQTDTQAKLDQLRDLLVAKGVLAWDEAAGAYEPVVGTYPMVLAQAYYNWIGLTEDRSLGAHNPPYVNALLLNTINALK
jgi:hypothetical protein